MKNMFLLIVVPVLPVTLGFGQAPTLSSNTDEASIKGCLGGSDGNYTPLHRSGGRHNSNFQNHQQHC